MQYFHFYDESKYVNTVKGKNLCKGEKHVRSGDLVSGLILAIKKNFAEENTTDFCFKNDLHNSSRKKIFHYK